MEENPRYFQVFGKPIQSTVQGMARLSRQAQGLDLSEALLKELHQSILLALGHVEPVEVKAKTQVASPATLPESNENQVQAACERNKAPSSVAQLDLRLRQLVERNAPWRELNDIAWTLFHAAPDHHRAARLVELAYLHGAIGDVVGVMKTLTDCQQHYFSDLHAGLRCRLGVRLWQGGHTDLLAASIASIGGEDKRLPSEHLFWFWRAMHGQDPSQPFVYFQRYEDALLKGAAEFGKQAGFGLSRLCYVVGKLAIELGFEATARRILEKIDRDAVEYGSALELLLKSRIDKNEDGQSSYVAHLKAEKDWKERVRLLRTYLVDANRLGAFRDRNRAALNELLKDPLQWLPAQPSAWQALSELLVEFVALHSQLPCLFDTYRGKALTFLRPELDQALWEPALQELTSESWFSRYWRGVAYLHYYVARGPQYEASLWEAKELITRCEAHRDFPVSFSWVALHKSATQSVHKALHLHEQDRAMMLRQLKVATDPRLLAHNDVREYLSSCREPNYSVLMSLQYVARNQRQLATELSVLRRRIDMSHLTNRDIDRIWQIGVELGDFDLAWRAASVAHGRQSLKKLILHPWQISGENRSDYAFAKVEHQDIERCMDGFHPDERRLVDACVKVGPLLPDLLACLDAGARAVKASSPPVDSPANRVHQYLAATSWLPVPRKVFQFSHERLVDSQVQLPQFMQVLPNNTWSYLIVQLSQRLGISSWSWQVSKLYRQIEDIIPRLASRQSLARHSVKVARWLRQLTSQQRSAWQDMAQLAGKMSDQQASDCLAKFLIRLAIMVYPHHSQSLSSLRDMRVDLNLTWEAEAWLLSEAYSHFRRERKLENRVSVPKSLRQTDSIIGPMQTANGR